MAKRWSKLQSRLYRLIDPALNFQIHCAVYEMNSNGGWHGNKLPRYFITIGKEIVFDYPKDFDTTWEYIELTFQEIKETHLKDILPFARKLMRKRCKATEGKNFPKVVRIVKNVEFRKEVLCIIF